MMPVEPFPHRPSDQITVAVLKHDGVEYRRWHGRLVEYEGPLVVLDAEFEADVSHHLLGEIKRGSRLLEYYWLDRYYNVFRFLHDDGSTRLYYCNINKPPTFDGQMLTYVDLDIDLIVRPDYSYDVLDLEEFAANAKHYGYSDDEKENVAAALKELLDLIRKRQFPFQPIEADALAGAF